MMTVLHWTPQCMQARHTARSQLSLYFHYFPSNFPHLAPLSRPVVTPWFILICGIQCQTDWTTSSSLITQSFLNIWQKTYTSKNTKRYKTSPLHSATHLVIKPSFHYPSSRPEFTARELWCIFWHPSWRPELMGVKNAPELTARQLGPSTGVSKNAPEFTGRQLSPWTRAVNSGSGNWA